MLHPAFVNIYHDFLRTPLQTFHLLSLELWDFTPWFNHSDVDLLCITVPQLDQVLFSNNLNMNKLSAEEADTEVSLNDSRRIPPSHLHHCDRQPFQSSYCFLKRTFTGLSCAQRQKLEPYLPPFQRSGRPPHFICWDLSVLRICFSCAPPDWDSLGQCRIK